MDAGTLADYSNDSPLLYPVLSLVSCCHMIPEYSRNVKIHVPVTESNLTQSNLIETELF